MKKLIVLFMALPLILSAALEMPEFKLKDFGSNGQFKLETFDGEDVNGKFTLYNGKTKKFAVLKNGVVSDNKAVFKYGKLDIVINFSPRTRMVLAEVTLKNNGSEDLWLEPGFRLTLPRAAGDFFFNGFDTLEVKNEKMERLGFKCNSMKNLGGFGTPLSIGIYGNAKKSFVLGNVMFDKISWNGTRVNSLKADSAALNYSIRSAVGPGRSVTLRFVIGVTATCFGKETGGIQMLYDSFPEQWTPYVGQDNKYIWKTHGMYRYWTYKPDREVLRRYHSGWDWAYVPYKRSGDIYGHKELWDYKPLAKAFKLNYINKMAGGEFGSFDWNKLSVEEFHKNRDALFKKYGKRFGYAFYPTASGTWCELALAQSRYPDAISTDTDGVVPIYKNGWTNRHDQDCRVFQMGTSFGEQLRKDTKLIYKQLDLPGFSFDCAGCGAYYRGPAVNNYDLPGRAWDDKGVYIDSSVGTMSYVDFIREELAPEKPRHQRPFIAGNGSVNVDAVMLECSTFSPNFQLWMPQWRYTFGALPGLIHGHGYVIPSTIPDWQSLTREQFLTRFTALAIYQAFTELRYGMHSSAQLYHGNRMAQYQLPELLECIRNGWQLQVPVKCDNGSQVLYSSRYGRGENTILFYGNPYEKPMPSKFAVVNRLLGKGTCLFTRKMRDAASLNQRIVKGETRFDFTIPARLPLLFEAVCSLSNLPDTEVTVSSEKDINKVTFKVDFANQKPFTSAVSPRWIYNFSDAKIMLNGKDIAAGKEVEFAENSTMTLEYTSKIYKTTAKEILAFPFLNSQKEPDFEIRIARGSQAEVDEAESLRHYFRYAANAGLCKRGVVPIVRRDSGNPYVELKFTEKDPAKHGIYAGKNVLRVVCGSAEEGEEMLKMLLYVMDIRFEHYFGISGGIDGFPGNISNHFKITGESVPEDMPYFFESKGRNK